MSSKTDKAALQLEQIKKGMTKNQATKRINTGDNHEPFYHHCNNCFGGSKGKSSSQRQLDQTEVQGSI